MEQGRRVARARPPASLPPRSLLPCLERRLASVVNCPIGGSADNRAMRQLSNHVFHERSS